MRDDGFEVETIYVDSASTDGSPQRAAARGVRVIEVRPARPSAALGRNAGWRAARGEYILFLDGDTILHPDFVSTALAAMADSRVAVVWGHRREMDPGQSAYVRVLDLDWVYPPGPSEFCGGDALMRRSVLAQVDGFDANLIAGEEPELCRRIRSCGHTIQHIDAHMTLHDLAITRFSAYWKRAVRAGHAYAEVSTRFRESTDPLWLADSRRNLVRGSLLLAVPPALVASIWLPWLSWLLVAALAALLIRTTLRCAWKTPDMRIRIRYAIHSQFQQVPILIGQLAWHLATLRGQKRRLIEYKQ
jgi:cellulose synthase/poly-beta-1,6-N-acetylglucosamine synthase-like glycosyltransferase